MKKKLLVMASTFPRWKNDTNPPFVYELSKRLVNDFDVTILAPSFPGSKKFEIMDEMKVHRFRYFIHKFEKLAGSGGILPTLKKNKLYYFTVPFFLLGEYLAARKLIKKEKFDIIHTHWIIPQGIIAYLINKKYKVPYVVTSHGSDILGLKGFTKLKKNILKNAKNVTVVGDIIKKEILQKIDKSINVNVIPMGIDTKLFNPNKKNENLKKKYNINGPFLLFIGRLAPEKGIKFLIEAMPTVIKKYPKTKLLIIGEGTLEKELKKLVKKLDINQNILFLGNIPNKELPKYYATSDLFIGPSLREGFGLVFLEAACCGAKILGPKLDSIEKIIKEFNNGKTISKFDKENTSNNILKLIKNKNKKFINVKKYDWEYIVKKYNKILKNDK
jgi:glycosyltransferase involved in cell wall biosynthesis